MENHFLDKHLGHGLVLGPFDYSVILNWTYLSTRNASSGSLPEFPIDTYHPSLSPLGVASATLIAFLLSSRGAFHKIKHVVHFQNLLYGVLVVAFLLLMFPFLAILALYRGIIFCILQMGSSTFIALMEGPDAVWTLKDPSQPIITVLAEVEAEEPESLLKNIRETILKTILINPKLSWKRKYCCMGFSYWEMCHDLSSLKEQVRWMPHVQQTLEDHITLHELQLVISNITHHGLPEDNTCWEILVSRQRLLREQEESKMIYPVLFRIHHSLGDGVSLLQLLLNSLSTTSEKQPENCSHNFYKFSPLSEKMKNANQLSKKDDFYLHKNLNNFKNLKITNDAKYIHTHDQEVLQKQQRKEVLDMRKNSGKNECKRGVTEVFISRGKIRFCSKQIESNHQLQTFISSFKSNINLLSFIVFNLQAMQLLIYSLKEIKRTCELSILDAEKISGKKLIAWYTDSPQGNVFSSIKRIKSEVKGVRFTDIFLTAFSRKIKHHLTERKASIPNCISVVVPVYTTPYLSVNADKIKQNSLNMKIRLTNSFSLGVLNLPVKIGDQSFVSHLKKVAQNMDLMRKSGQYTLNSFILKWVANLFPEPLLNIFLQIIGHYTMVVSNLVGPTDILFLAGYPLRNIYFWVPQRGNTGLSVSILSYCNRIQLGMMADNTIMNNADEVQTFLDEVASEVLKSEGLKTQNNW